MSLFQTIILAALQGLTEFLPISSSGHLIILPKIFNWPLQPLAFDVILHLGSLVGVIFYFKNDLKKLLKALIDFKNKNLKPERQLIFLLLIGILPAALAGFFFNGFIELHFRKINIVVYNLIFWALFMILADFLARKTKTEKLNFKKALSIGIFQIFALIPGTSRSGVTISAGMLAKLPKKQTAKFSFLMSLPLIFGAGLLKAPTLFRSNTATATVLLKTNLIIGFLVSAIFSWLAIKLLIKTLEFWGLTVFAVYRILLAIVLITFL